MPFFGGQHKKAKLEPLVHFNRKRFKFPEPVGGQENEGGGGGGGGDDVRRTQRPGSPPPFRFPSPSPPTPPFSLSRRFCLALVILSSLAATIEHVHGLGQQQDVRRVEGEERSNALVSSFGFLQSECRTIQKASSSSSKSFQRNVTFSEDNSHEPTTSSSWNVFGHLNVIEQQDGRDGESQEDAGGGFGLACPDSVGVHFLGTPFTTHLVSSENCSQLVSDAKIRSESQRQLGVVVEVWLTFSEPGGGGADAIVTVGKENTFEEDKQESETFAEGGCSLGWNPFNFQLRQRGSYLEVEARWKRGYLGDAVCSTSERLALPLSRRSTRLQGEEENTTSMWVSRPHHVVVTLEEVTRANSSAQEDEGVVEGMGLLSVYLDGEALEKKKLSSDGERKQTSLGFFETWDHAFHLLVGSPTKDLSSSWRGKVHSVNLHVGTMSQDEVRARSDAFLPPASEPVAYAKVVQVKEDEDSILELESFDFDSAYGSEDASALTYFITRTVQSGKIWDPTTGVEVDDAGGEANSISNSSSSNQGFKLASSKVLFRPETNAFSHIQTSQSHFGSLQEPYTSLDYMACNSRNRCSIPKTVLVEVLGVNDPPIAVGGAAQVHLGIVTRIDFQGMDVDGDTDIAGVDIVELPLHGQLNDCTANGSALTLGANATKTPFRLMGKQYACYTFTDERAALDGMRTGKEVVAHDRIAFKAVDSELVKSNESATVDVSVLNPLVGMNMTVACDEDAEASFNLSFRDVRAHDLGELELVMLTLPQFGILYGASEQEQGSNHSDSHRIQSHRDEQMKSFTKPCTDGVSKCTSFVYVPGENFFNSPDLLSSSKSARYRNMGLNETMPSDTFAFEIRTTCCRSPVYHVNLQVANIEDESKIRIGQHAIDASFLVPSPIPGLKIDDPDLYLDLFLVDLSVVDGLLNIDSEVRAMSYVTFLAGDGHDDRRMVFKGLIHMVNEALANLTYTPLSRFGEDQLEIRITDMNAVNFSPWQSNVSYASHASVLNITIRDSGKTAGDMRESSGGEVCVPSIAFCLPETILYGVLFVLLMLLFLSPFLYLVYRGSMSCLRCKRKRSPRTDDDFINLENELKLNKRRFLEMQSLTI